MISGQKFPPLKLHRLAAANDRLRVARPRALLDAQAQGDIDMNTRPDLNKSKAMAATGQTKAAAAVQVKSASHGYYIDHPDPELGEQVMYLRKAPLDAMR